MPIPKSKITADAKKLEDAARQLEQGLEVLLLRYKNEFRKFIKNPDRYSKTEVGNLALKQQVYVQVNEVLENAGLDSVLRKHLENFPVLTDSALSLFTEFNNPQALNWVGVSQDNLTAVVGAYRDNLVRELDQKLVAPMQSAVLSQTFLVDRTDDAVEAVLSTMDNISVRQAQRLVDDQYNQYSRAVKLETANRLGLNVFVYVGPLDKATSPQCREILTGASKGAPAGYYKREDINTGMASGLSYDPFLYGGHPGCRHQFVPLSDEEAEELGIK